MRQGPRHGGDDRLRSPRRLEGEERPSGAYSPYVTEARRSHRGWIGDPNGHLGRVEVLALLAIVLLLAGCPKPPPHVALGGEWPATAGAYGDVTASWTRRGQIRADYQQVAEVFATFKSPAWRSAWVERRANRGKLSDQARAELLEEQRTAEAEAWEVQVVLTTWDRKENDLDRGERSVWRLTLVDADGNEVAPTEIVRDRRPNNIIRSEFPGYGDFSEAYVARFPKEARVLGPGVAKIGLRISSTRGGIELWWEAP